MTGETNLDKLLASMKPRLLDGEYVFCTFKGARYGDFSELMPLASYLEEEGLTLLVIKANADNAELSYEAVFKGITLTVHSSLEAVGLTAAIASKLTEKGISANVIAAYYHDHIFVQAEKAELAIAALHEFSA
ncbi:ACT domain-containing protein [Dasania marina]|uniref:ACT domain-containing protein n=1 Tax=Dasania marina TaxID=471499 RepID=UPI0030D78945|tara:strand:- start:75235 stop:75633 length:399 start_codon:yes stop_codon:yes gene_type:complete